MDKVEVKRKKLYKLFMDAHKYWKKRGITTKCKEKAKECLPNKVEKDTKSSVSYMNQP